MNRKKINFSIINIIVFLLIVIFGTSLPSQEVKKAPDIAALMGAEKYREALDAITVKLNEIYGSRVEDKRIPSEFISLKNTSEDIDLKRLFRERKAKGFFIEENPPLSTLHRQAGLCYYHLKQYNRSVNHFLQSLRFKKLEPYRDDVIYYGMSQAFLKGNRLEAYYHHLEAAYTLNPEKYEYSRELAVALSRTVKKRKALFHLVRYLRSGGAAADPKLVLLAATLYESTGRYLQSVEYYRKYLEMKPKNGPIHFALGVISMKQIGDYSQAKKSFGRAAEYLPKDDISRRSRLHEYLGDMALHDRKFREAVREYRATIGYQERVKKNLDAMEGKIRELKDKITAIKRNLLKTQNYDQFEEYELLRSEKGKLELEFNRQKLKYEKLNAGKVRWNTAYSLERLGELERAIQFYRFSISFDYRANDAREKIVKLKLKIKRGY